MKVFVAGDFCPQNRVIEKFDQGDYEFVLGDIKELISDADYSIINLECPVMRVEGRPIKKCGPNLKCSEKGLDAIKWVGFDGVSLANNHFLDYGEEGVEYTLEACKKYGIDVVGGGKNIQEASRILYKEFDGKTLAIINCCEHEFSIATDNTAGSNPLNPIQQYYAIQEAKTKADYVLVIVHGGHEHYQLPSIRMQDTYRFFVDSGADAVVNHHQHCFSGYEVYKRKPIFYGLGNFCFDRGISKNSIWYEGFMVSICFDKQIQFELHPYSQCKEQATVRLEKIDTFAAQFEKLNTIINNRQLLKKNNVEYYASSLDSANMALSPISNRYIRFLQHWHLFPKYRFGSKLVLRLYNFLLCEAHKDKIDFFLKSEYTKCSQ